MIGLLRRAWSGTVVEEIAEWVVMSLVSMATLVSTLRLLGVLS